MGEVSFFSSVEELVGESGGFFFGLEDAEGPIPILQVKRNIIYNFLLLPPPSRTSQSSHLTVAGLVVAAVGREVIYQALQGKINS